ncbi:hypothetical protein [Variovorax paradoxus]|uniref:hypothetical protein n=1 Tax=Variovorax paradoxus TaxID=34073 RepID=UPI0019334ACB|nr:hypothetical protein INQ48_13675 [Variovorax paradoxus]
MHLIDTTPAPSRANDIIALQMAAQHLIESARERGLVVTIDLKPIAPLAMGRYEMVYQVREARSGR